VIYEIVNLLKHTRAATDVISGHVPENGGTFVTVHCEIAAACCLLKRSTHYFRSDVPLREFDGNIKAPCGRLHPGTRQPRGGDGPPELEEQYQVGLDLGVRKG
jgi:hypothetical protein